MGETTKGLCLDSDILRDIGSLIIYLINLWFIYIIFCFIDLFIKVWFHSVIIANKKKCSTIYITLCPKVKVCEALKLIKTAIKEKFIGQMSPPSVWGQRYSRTCFCFIVFAL